jgi:cell division protein FtsB
MTETKITIQEDGTVWLDGKIVAAPGRAEVLELRERNAYLSAEAAQLRERNAYLSAEVAELRERNAYLSLVVDSAAEILGVEFSMSIPGTLRQLRKRNEELERQIASLEAANNQWMTQVVELQKIVSELERLSALDAGDLPHVYLAFCLKGRTVPPREVMP